MPSKMAVKASTVRVVRSAINPDRFLADDRLKRRHAERAAWNAKPDEVVGLFVAMNYRLKGLAQLLDAFALVPRGKLVVVGNPKFARYQRQAQRLGIADRVVFLGHRGETRDCYFAADYLVHPTFYDPCSLVALEALACGLPVITSRYNGAAELLSPPADGLVIANPHDASELATAMSRMLDREYLSSATAAARATAAKWTFEQHYQALLDVFCEVRQIKRAA
jgi:UDP-glucose:(heptosyl)LPS alpha-1,3-glucosyltransferase